MVGRLSLPDAPQLPDAQRALDSPDSGLPPSPNPGTWLLSGGGGGGGGGGSERGLANGLPGPPQPPAKDPASSFHPLLPGCTLRLCPLSFGEGVEFDPLPPKDIRYTSSVKYDSEKHFINNIDMPLRLGASSCSQTVVCVPDSTWRSYKAEVRFQPRNRARSFSSTTIVYPKHTKTVYTTTLDYNCRKYVRKFLSSVELESSGKDNGLNDC
ncbi:refilin-B [Elgaria multicarinata webbii]|uniref:refilin-B n=1 Tax=Elgaria multicarinata webbii TaxID=159646 RepID=UPI002FCD24B5